MSFEHIRRTQPLLAARLSEEWEKGLIPQCVLFSGPAYAGKMTAAVELALTILHQEEKFPSLDTSDLVIVSSRDTAVRLKAVLADLRQKRNKRSLQAMLFELRVFLLGFHPALADSGDKALFGKAGDISEMLYRCDLDADDRNFSRYMDDLESTVFQLLDKRSGKGLFTIDQIRDIHAYLQLDSARDKCVILENIEDVTPGAMNSILKLLEEPPAGGHILLVSRNQGRILDTILSRVRKYQLAPIAPELEQRFLSQELFAPKESHSIEEHYYTLSGFDSSRLSAEAGRFLDRMCSGKDGSSADLMDLCSFLEPFNAYDRFLGQVSKEIGKRTMSGQLPAKRALSLTRLLTTCLNDAVTYNQNRRVMLERILKECCNEQ